MFKKVIYLFLILSLSSCSGLLWDVREGGDLTLSISNPFYQPGRSASSRALALQGQYIYIELALINDQAAYDVDTAKAVTGDGTWVETAWGGHAIVTLGITNLTELPEEISATFTDVPRDEELIARVFLDESQDRLSEGVQGGYGTDMDMDEIPDYAICQTLDPAISNYNETQWIPMYPDEMSDNLVTLGIRPYEPTYIDWSSGPYVEEILGDSFNLPESGKTAFYSVEYDLTTIYARDVAYFCFTQGQALINNGLSNIFSIMHDSLGYPFQLSEPSYSYIGPYYEYKNLQIHPVLLPDFESPDYVVSSTLTSEVLVGSVAFGLLFDSNLSAGDINADLEVNWDIPEGMSPDSLEFKMIHIDGISIPSKNIDTVENIYNQTFINEFAWNEVSWNGSNFSYFSGGSNYFPPLGSWLVVLARVPGGEPFIYGKTQIMDFNV